MTDKATFDIYLTSLRKTRLEDKTEHTDRAALEALLGVFAGGGAKDAKVQHEPKRSPEKGAPDFKISKKGLILGYVEAKTIGVRSAADRDQHDA